MPMPNAALNPRQVEVLQWIADGCPDAVMVGYTHKTTAIALQSRKLVTVTRKRGVWRAVATPSGQHYLHPGDYPAQRPGRGATSPTSVLSGEHITRTSSTVTVTRDAQHDRFAHMPAAERLVAQVVAAGGTLAVDRRIDRRNFDSLVCAVTRSGKAPAGTQLVMDWTGSWDHRVIRLVDLPTWVGIDADVIAVPGTLRNPHTVVTALSKDTKFDITGPARARAFRLIQALIAESLRRGHRVQPGSFEHDRPSYRARRSSVDIVVQDHAVRVHVRQRIDRTPHQPTARELARAARESWYQPPKYDEAPSARLTIELPGYDVQGQARWSDTANRTIDTQLPAVFYEIELRAAAAGRARQAAEHAAAHRREQWEAAMIDAKAAYTQAHLVSALNQQVADWIHANQMREYLDAMQATVDAMTDQDATHAAQEWLAWCRRSLRRTDPLLRPAVMPTVAEPDAADLRPFLCGHNPYGPSGFARAPRPTR